MSTLLFFYTCVSLWYQALRNVRKKSTLCNVFVHIYSLFNFNIIDIHNVYYYVNVPVIFQLLLWEFNQMIMYIDDHLVSTVN